MTSDSWVTSIPLSKPCLVVVLILFLAYYLLQLGSPNMIIFSITDQHETLHKGLFIERIVHLDLKGAPLRLDAYKELFPFLAKYHATGLLIEYEDMFPFSGNLSSLSRRNAYTQAEIKRIIELAEESNLEVIPLIQTFGHLEFVLKQPKFMKYSENPAELNTICITNEDGWQVITEMIDQIRSLHPHSRRIHIGADEAYHVGEDQRCQDRLLRSFDGHKDAMGVAHIARVARYAREVGGFTTIFAWNDMFDKTSPETLKFHKLGELITPVIWGYREDVTEIGYFAEGLFDRIDKVFPSLFFATAFKGANGQSQPFIDINRYLFTHRSYVKLLKNSASVGFFVVFRKCDTNKVDQYPLRKPED